MIQRQLNCNVNVVYLTMGVKMAVKDRWEEFGEWLAEERGKAGVAQKLVAIKAAISPVQLNRIEKGNSGAKRQTVIDIVEAINDHSSTAHRLDLEEALNRAGFASYQGHKQKPQNVAEFVGRLSEMGFDIRFDADYEQLGPDDLQDLLDDIEAKLVVKTQRRQGTR